MWNAKIQEVHAAKKKEDKERSRPNSTKLNVEAVANEAEETIPEGSGAGQTNEDASAGKINRSESLSSLAGSLRKSTGPADVAPGSGADSKATNVSVASNQSTAKEDQKKSPFLATLACLASQPLQFPFPSAQHMLLPACVGVPVIIYEKEPSSIIAYTLSSVEYKNYLVDLQTTGNYIHLPFLPFPS
jgi:1-phosphatidylinositol-3-phosphate 5-kinase